MSTSQKGSRHIKHTLHIDSSSYRPSKGVTPIIGVPQGSRQGGYQLGETQLNTAEQTKPHTSL